MNYLLKSQILLDILKINIYSNLISISLFCSYLINKKGKTESNYFSFLNLKFNYIFFIIFVFCISQLIFIFSQTWHYIQLISAHLILILFFSLLFYIVNSSSKLFHTNLFFLILISFGICNIVIFLLSTFKLISANYSLLALLFYLLNILFISLSIIAIVKGKI